MPRGPRITIRNSCYHIITRGNQKQPVFLEEADYKRYLSFLARYKRKFEAKVYAFCLMPNHIHLILNIENPENVSKIMKCLNLSYALFFNSKYDKVGHLWQDRFKSKIIENSSYLLECINYVEMNPVRSNLISNITKYPWTSYNFKVDKSDFLDELFMV